MATERLMSYPTNSAANLALAKLACEMAVREGVFEKCIGYSCPNDDCQRMITSTSEGDHIDEPLICEHCEAVERDKCIFRPDECRKIVFYRLVPQAVRSEVAQEEATQEEAGTA